MISRISLFHATILSISLFQYGCSPVNEQHASDKSITKNDENGTEATKPTELGISGKTMGTTYSVKWVNPPSKNELTAEEIEKNKAFVKRTIEIRLAEVNKAMSTYDPNSEISILNAKPKGVYEISEHFYTTLVIANAVSEHTLGAFDATVSPLINLWGFGHEGKVTKQPSDEDIKTALEKTGYNKLSLIPKFNEVEKYSDVTINLSAIAKGYGVDVLAKAMQSLDIENFFIEVGGEVLAKGKKSDGSSWKVGIEKPKSSERTIQQVLNVSNTAIATSGDYRNYFEENGIRFSHTINPKTGKPITHKLASVSVLKNTCAEADAYATALMVMGDKKGVTFAKENGIDALFIVKSTNGFKEISTGNFAKRILPLPTVETKHSPSK